MDGNLRVARFIRDLAWEDLPPEVKQKAKTCLLDGLGAVLCGSRARIAEITARYVAGLWSGAGDATLFLQNRRSSTVGAALANGCAANALDMDDDGAHTRGHPGAQIVPAALAVGEAQGVSGKELLTALVVGYEVAHRAGHCWHDHHAVYQACGSWGSMACAAVAARLAGLEVEQIQHALGIAEYHAPNLPMMRDIDHPAMVKHGIGWGAMTGVMAAGLAAAGYTGIPSILGFEQYRAWIDTIGRNYLLLEGITFKRFACCLWAHPAFAAASHLMRTHGIRAEQIEKIVIDGFHEMHRLGTAQPATEEQAQFSVAWPLAAYILEGEVTPRQMLAHRFTDPALRGLTARIVVVEDQEITDLCSGERYCCRLHITAAGRTLSSDVVFYDACGSGDGRDAFGDIVRHAEVVAKFLDFGRCVLDEPTLERLVDGVDRLDGASHVRDLLALIPAAPRES